MSDRKNRLIFDGAFGTYYFSLYGNGALPELANIEYPERVEAIHREYLKAGATALKTNTFCANSLNIEDREILKKIIVSGMHLAERASEGKAEIFADIGNISDENAEERYLETAGIFAKAGARNFLFETLSDFSPVKKSVDFVRKNIPDSFVMVSFAVDQSGFSSEGKYYCDLIAEALDNGADVAGLNCVCGPLHMAELLEAFKHTDRITAMPNAGYPSSMGGRNVFVDNPDYFSELVSEMWGRGVFAVGGCCGTTPNHIKALTDKIGKARKSVNISVSEKVSEHKNVSTSMERNIIAVEIPAPADTDWMYLDEAASELKNAGADYITVPDSPLGKARANSVSVSSLIYTVSGIRTIPHICCRDKNQIAIRGDLLYANRSGIKHVLAVTGDPLQSGFDANVKNVFGFTSFGLIEYIKLLNQNVFQDSPFTVCAAFNSNAENIDAEIERAKKKENLGVDCFFTQPIFSEKDIENYFRAQEKLHVPVMAGIMPLAGYRNALFLSNEVHGIVIPEEVIRNLKDKTREEASGISIGYSTSIIDKLRNKADGFYIMTPLKRWDLSLALVKYIKENV